MNTKLLILLVLGVSLVFFGCTKRASGGNETLPTIDAPENELPVANETPEDPGEPEEEPGEPSAPPSETTETIPETSEEELADLFDISTEEPVGGEGLDSESPSSE